MASATRTIRVRFDGSAKGLIKAAAEAGIAVEAFEKQTQKSSNNIVKSTSVFSGGLIGGFIDSLGALPSVLKGAAITAAVAIGAVMAPALAGVLISGILLAVSGGVLAAGIIGAAKSPKVVKAWKKFGRQAEVVFERFSKPFIQPLASAAKYFGFALARAEPTIKRIGEAMAPWVVELAAATAIFVEKLMPGILTAVTAAGPFIDILSVHLPLLAESIGRFFTAISTGSASAQVFFDRFLTWVEDVIPKMGGVLAWLSNLGPKIDTVSEKLTPLKEALATVGDFIKDGMQEAREMFHTWLDKNREKIDKLIVQLSGFVTDTGPAFKLAIEGIAVSLQASANAVIAVIDALDRLKRWYNSNKNWLMTLMGVTPWFSNQESGIPGIGQRAEGGPVTAGRSYLVGEKGQPEIFTPGASGYVTPLDKMGTSSTGNMAPIIVENHIEIGGEVVRVVRTEIREHNRGVRRGVAMAGAV